MTYEELLMQTEQGIKQAIEDYWEYTDYCRDNIKDAITDDFICEFAKQSIEAKQGLRELFSQSPNWNPELDALVIDGNYIKETDIGAVAKYLHVCTSGIYNEYGSYVSGRIEDLIMYFVRKGEMRFNPDLLDDNTRLKMIDIIRYAPKAAKKKNGKLSQFFMQICKDMNAADLSKGSHFQKYYALLADEISSRPVDVKLFVSINPAHFLTMSNPKHDDRGSTLVSCHSLNQLDYRYNNGCTGYALDNVSFIAFTTADPSNPETLNNRKTTRQIYAYEPGEGVLFQSRMYNTNGGTHSAQNESQVYRNLIQKEICAIENVPNTWKKPFNPAVGEDHKITVLTSCEFGGYSDWYYEEYQTRVCIREDVEVDKAKDIVVGAAGMCLSTGERISTGLFAEELGECDHCGSRVWMNALTETANSAFVCAECLEDDYFYCEECGTYHNNEEAIDYIDEFGNDKVMCRSCAANNLRECMECESYHPVDEVKAVYNAYGDLEGYVCSSCLEHCTDEYDRCDECNMLYIKEDLISYNDGEGFVCPDCTNHSSRYVRCDVCGEMYTNDQIAYTEDGPKCRYCEEHNGQNCLACNQGVHLDPESWTAPLDTTVALASLDKVVGCCDMACLRMYVAMSNMIQPIECPSHYEYVSVKVMADPVAHCASCFWKSECDSYDQYLTAQTEPDPRNAEVITYVCPESPVNPTIIDAISYTDEEETIVVPVVL